MNRIIILLFALVPFVTKAQETEARHPICIGLNSGVDFNFNAFRLIPDNNGFKYYGINPHYNIGIDFGLKISKKLRARLEFKFVKMSYGMDWDDFNSTFDKTTTKLYNLDLNLHADYLLLTSSKLQIFISPGIKGEMVSRSKYILKKKDGSTEEVNFNIIGHQYSKYLLGGALAGIVKYNLNDHIGITLIPEYTVFFGNFIKSNDKSYQRFSTNIGLEFKF